MSGDIEFNKKERRKRRIAVFGLSTLMMIAMIAAVYVGIKDTAHKSMADDDGLTTSHKAIRSVCHIAEYQKTCERTLANVHTANPNKLVTATFNAAIENIEGALANSSTIKAAKDDHRTAGAVETCKQVMEYAIGDLKRSGDQMGNFDVQKKDEYIENMRVWLSGAITLQETCIDAFENTTGDAGEKMKGLLNTSREITSNSLDIATELANIFNTLNESKSAHKKSEEGHKSSNSHESSESESESEPGEDESKSEDKSENGEDESESGDHKRKLLAKQVKRRDIIELPHWVDIRRRKLLHEVGSKVKADIVVAKDGSGNFKTITGALKLAPVTDVNKATSSVNRTFVIYIKEGIYEEDVLVEATNTHVMLIGDGPTKTKVTGSKNFADGLVVYKTATASILGNKFIAKDISFENKAPLEKHQAVALLVQSDMSIFYNCHINSNRNTLFALSYRQFYRKCTISGTVDFIIGNAAAIFQNCKLVIRKPLENQECVITAQGRLHLKGPTGFIMQNCTIMSDPLYYPVRQKNKAFLGRPWKKFSRTIVMQSFIPDSIAPEGWKSWMGTFGQSTCFFSEFENRGPGASLTGRVKWAGYKKIDAQEADGFTPGKFYAGDRWIKPSEVPYVSGMNPVSKN